MNQLAKRFLVAALLATSLLAPASLRAQAADEVEKDPLFKAMVEELKRVRQLRLAANDDVYFAQYTVDESAEFTVRATLGALISRLETMARFPRIDIRVGTPELDNTNYVYSDYLTGRNRVSSALPIDDNVTALRSYFWLATDAAYKGALTALARKRAALRSVNRRDELPDFAAAEPVVLIDPPDPEQVDTEAWTGRTRSLSALFARHPEITFSLVRFSALRATSYQVNSEGTRTRYPENLYFLEVRAQAQAGDGMLLRNADVIESLDIENMPPPAELERSVEKVGDDLVALLQAPVTEPYVGPVLFEGEASAQLFAQLLGENLSLSRRPVSEPGRPVPYSASELNGRVGARVLPEWMTVVDDPTQSEWRGQPLLGHYQVDIEGVRPEPLTLVENGILKGYLLTRQPVDGFVGSNGRARLPGQFGANQASFGNLFVQASETTTEEGLVQRLLELAEQRGKEYGIVIRKLDFPSSASVSELRQLSAGRRERGTAPTLVGNPILAYRVYPDGREELVRGFEFRALTVRVLRDILAASDESHLFHFLRNNTPLSLMGAGGFMTANSVAAPSILIEDVELDLDEEEMPATPLVPPPDLVAVE